MQYMLAVYGAPCESQAPQTALAFAQALIAAGHRIYRVFFYRGGVQIASSFSILPQDESSLRQKWSAFASRHDIELVICMTAAMRHGLLDKEEAVRRGRHQWNVDAPFVLSGLGQLAEGITEADRLIVFGE